MNQASRRTDAVCHHGEGPVWWPGWGGLRWVDMMRGDLMALGPDDSVSRTHVAGRLSCVRPRGEDGAVVSLERQIGVLGAIAWGDESASVTPLCDPLWTTEDVLFNEGACDPSGAFWAGSATDEGRPDAGALYRFAPGGPPQVVLEPVTISNGLAWSPDGETGYYVDSATWSVRTFSGLGPEPGRSLELRPFVDIPRSLGEPDGITVDVEGHVWVAVWGGFCVKRFDPAGREVATVSVPAPNVTACTFGGDDLSRLFITTSQLETDLERYPEAGSLFSVETDVRGLLPLGYAG